MRRLIAVSCAFLLFMLPAGALRAGQGAAVIETLRLAEIVAVMRAEGIAHGEGVGETMLGSRGTGAAWTGIVAAIHDEARMLDMLEGGLDAALPEDAAAVAPVLAFFAGDLGQRILTLEISARQAMLDEAVETAAREGWAVLEQRDRARVERLRRLADAGDLIEQNVVGGLNSTYAFYLGLMESDAQGFGMGRQELLEDVRGQEPDIRAEIEGWLDAYLGLAYGPLDLADLDAYVAVFESPGGRQLNAALFAAFNAMFETLSHELGLAAGRMMLGEDL